MPTPYLTAPASAEPFTEGMHAGLAARTANLNPHPLGTPEHAEWLRGLRSVPAIGFAGCRTCDGTGTAEYEGRHGALHYGPCYRCGGTGRAAA